MLTETAPAVIESDLSLLKRYTETSDPDIFSEIVRRYTGVVYAASQRILQDDARAKDVAQETFFRLLRQPYLVTHSLGGWLHRSATHLAIDAKRSETSRRRREKAYFLKRDAELGASEPQWEDVSPHVDQALAQLPEPTRTLLIRHFLQGTAQAVLAEEMNASAATISRKIKAGVEELQKVLKQKGIYIGMLALTEFCVTETSKAVPAALRAELGKMQMVGPVSLSPAPPAGPPIHWPKVYPASRVIVDSTVGMLMSGIGAAALIAFFTVIVLTVSSITHSSRPTRQTQDVEQQIRQTGQTIQDLKQH